MSYMGGKLRKNKPGMLSRALFFLLAAGNIGCYLLPGPSLLPMTKWFSLPNPGSNYRLIRLSCHAKLFIISNKHDVLVSICHPLFVQNSGGNSRLFIGFPQRPQTSLEE